MEATKQNAPASLEIGTFVEAALPRSLLENKCNSPSVCREWHFQAICKTMVMHLGHTWGIPPKSLLVIELEPSMRCNVVHLPCWTHPRRNLGVQFNSGPAEQLAFHARFSLCAAHRLPRDEARASPIGKTAYGGSNHAGIVWELAYSP